MNHQARNLPAIAGETCEAADNVALRVPTEHDDIQTADHRYLLYLVPLEQKRPRCSQTRRLRLRDALAGGSARRNAAILARDTGFWDYLQMISLTAYDEEIDTRRARHFINRLCGVQGRQELDRPGPAAERFFTLIETPFLEWLLADC